MAVPVDDLENARAFISVHIGNHGEPEFRQSVITAHRWMDAVIESARAGQQGCT